MGLLKLAQDKRVMKALEKADVLLSPFSLLLMVVGICWLLVFPVDMYWRRRYFSENALLESQANCKFGRNDVLELSNISTELQQAWSGVAGTIDGEQGKSTEQISSEQTIKKIESIFSNYGLTTEIQKFGYKKLPNGEIYQGNNVHGILHAPRSDHVESLVIFTSLETGKNESNFNAIQLLSGFAYFASKQNYWAKDVIFLVTDSGEAGIEEWLKAYHGVVDASSSNPSNILRKRSGAIQGALGLEFPPVATKNGYQSMGTFFVSNTGQLPNLDYINIVTSIARFQGLESIYNGFDNDDDENISFIAKYLKSFRWLAEIFRGQIVGQETNIHVPFLKYKIDALTLRGSPKDTHSYLGVLDDDFAAVGRIIESITRSLNNLLEHFHQSFFFYLLPALDWYIPIGDYMPVIGIMSASLLFQAMGLWISIRRNKLSSVDSETRIEYQCLAYGQLRAVVPGAFKAALVFHGLGFAIYAAYMSESRFAFGLGNGSLLILLASLMGASVWYLSSQQTGASAIDWRATKMIVNLYTSIAISVLSMINFSVSLLTVFVVGIPLLLARPFANLDPESSRLASMLGCKKGEPACKSTLLLPLVINPLVAAVVASYFGSSYTISQLWDTLLSEHFLFGATTFPVLTLIHMPVFFLTILINLLD